jgi:hypothetical protein
MPAVELARLRMQINGLIALFGNPAAFCRALGDLLYLYANHTYRPGQAVQPQPLLPSYRVAALVMRQLELELGKTCQEQPEQALEIIEALWKDTHLEPRLLATSLLGSIPIQYDAAVIEKLRSWGQPQENYRILDALFENGTVMLRRSGAPLLLALLEEWINKPGKEALGIRACVPLVKDSHFENLPVIFRLLGPLVQNVPGPLLADLHVVLVSLIERSPIETSYFLRQELSLANNPTTARLVRRCMPSFEPAQQASLRAALQAAGQS